MIQDTDITAWLGGTGFAVVGLTGEQVEQFSDLVRAHEAQVVASRPHYGTEDYDTADYANEDEAAWIAAYQLVTGTLNLDRRGREYVRAREAAYQGAVIVQLAKAARIPGGMSEEAAAQAARMSRMTLRKALGKA